MSNVKEEFDWSGSNLIPIEDVKFHKYDRRQVRINGEFKELHKPEPSILQRDIDESEWRTEYEEQWYINSEYQRIHIDEEEQEQHNIVIRIYDPNFVSRDGTNLIYPRGNLWRYFKYADKLCNPSISSGAGWARYEWRNEWREQVLEDWNNQCAVCGEDEGLHAHHLNCRSEHPDEADDPDNGIILCEECHKEFHSWNGGYIKPCTKDDFQRWFEGDG